MKSSSIITAGLVPLASVLFLGCGTPAPTSAPPTTGQASHEHSHADHDHGTAGEVAEQLAKLTPADRAVAEKQQNCPVTDEPLGSMGVPPKVNVSGRDVFICCKGCEDELLQNADAYLAKLPKN
ncbi:MAG: hypothetical protein AB7O59_14970 [Pirellulales bacterium]